MRGANGVRERNKNRPSSLRAGKMQASRGRIKSKARNVSDFRSRIMQAAAALPASLSGRDREGAERLGTEQVGTRTERDSRGKAFVFPSCAHRTTNKITRADQPARARHPRRGSSLTLQSTPPYVAHSGFRLRHIRERFIGINGTLPLCSSSLTSRVV